MTPRRSVRHALAMAVVAVMALAGCTSTARTERGTSDGAGVVGVALATSDDLAVVRLGEALGEELRARGYRVDLQYAAGDDRTQAAQVQNMVTKGEDAVVLVPSSTDVLTGVRVVVDDARVPLITAGRNLDAGGAVEAVDPAATGRAQAEALLDALARRDPTSGAAGVALVTGVADDPDAAASHAAAAEALAPAIAAGEVRVVGGDEVGSAAVTDTRGDVATAAEQRVRGLVSGADGEIPDAILALGDAASRGVVTALTTPDPDSTPSPSPTVCAASDAAPRTPLVVVATGGDAVTVRALRDGVLTATVFVDTRAWAGPIADAVVAALAGDVPSPSVVPSRTVGRDDVPSVFVESGWLRPDDLTE